VFPACITREPLEDDVKPTEYAHSRGHIYIYIKHMFRIINVSQDLSHLIEALYPNSLQFPRCNGKIYLNGLLQWCYEIGLRT